MSPADPDRGGSPGAALVGAARVVLVVTAAAGLAIVAYAAVRYQSVSDARALAWYAFGVLVAIVSIVTRTGPGSRQVAIALTAVVSLLLLWTIEATLEIAPRVRLARTRAAVARHTGKEFDQRGVAEVVAARRAAGEAVVPSIVPKVLLSATMPDADPRIALAPGILPLSGVSRSRTVQLCNEDGQYPLYESDVHGFLNPPGVWDSLPATIVMIGDSFTHGYCVADAVSLAGRLRARWPRTLNIGTGGSGPLAELATLTEFGLPAKPRLVLWFFFENDLADLHGERAHPILDHYRESDFRQGLLERQQEMDSLLVPWVERAYRDGGAPAEVEGGGVLDFITLGATRRAARRFLAGPPPPDSIELPLFREVLAAADARTRAVGSRLVFVFLPRWERYFGGITPEMENRSAVLESARALGLPVVDVTEAFLRQRDHSTLFGRGEIGVAHYSPAGYALAARTVISAIDSLQLAGSDRR